MKASSLLRSLALLVSTAAVALHAQVPQLLNYQGRVVSNNTNFTGNGQFKFALVNAAGAVTYWSNDGTSVAGSQPAAAVSLPVASGLYAVLLGDTTIPNMTAAIPASVFNNSDVRLRIWFNDGVTGSQLLTPDQRIAAVGYAMMGATVPDGSITTAKLADGAITAAKIADGTVATADLAANSVNSGHIIDGQVLTADLSNNAVTSAKIADAGISTADLADGAVNSAKVLDASLLGTDLASNTVTSLQLADSINLGDAAVAGQLSIYRNAAGTPAITLNGTGTGGYQYLYQNDGQPGIYLDGDSGGGGLQYLYAADGGIGIRLDGESSGAGRIYIYNTNASTRISLDGSGTGTGGEIAVYAQDGSSTVQLLGESSGAGLINVNNNVSQNRVIIDGEGNGAGGQINLYAGDGGNGILLYGDSGGGGLQYLYAADGSIGISLDGDSGGAGYISVRGTNGSTRASLDGSDSGGGSMRLYESDGTETLTATSQGNGALVIRQGDGSAGVGLYGSNGTGGGGVTVYRDDGTFAGQLTVANATQDDGYLGLANRSGTTSFYARASSGSDSQGGYVGIRNAAGVQTITLNGDNDAAGDGRITTMELQITGGSDLSEQFDITASEATLLPGMVVCIDPKHPGQLMLSSRAHDRTVAGIVSGAGGVKPGMLMGQKGTAADGKHPVALTGRVYCWVDASHGAIEPGDLITTSDTPGHGMKVVHHTQAQGAILGKAMTGLAEGKGLVLVLVSLQ